MDGVETTDSRALFTTMCGVGFALAVCGLMTVPTLRVLCGAPTESLRLTWDVPHGAFCIGLDALSSFFLLPVLGLSILTAVYGGSYLLVYRGRKSIGVSWFVFNTFVIGMIAVLVARTALLFLMSWEVMSLSAYFLVTFEQEKAEVRRAGWIYLVATHLGVCFLIAVFVLLGRQAGSLEFEAMRVVDLGYRPAGADFDPGLDRLRGEGGPSSLSRLVARSPSGRPLACLRLDVRGHDQDGLLRGVADLDVPRTTRSLVGGDACGGWPIHRPYRRLTGRPST